MKSLITILFLSLISCSLQLKVAIYYEAFDQASKESILRSIHPGYEKFDGQVDFDFELIPYGRPSQQNEQSITANRIQACILNQDRSESDKISFLQCASMQQDTSSLFIIKTCIHYWGFDDELFDECFEGSLGDQLMAENAQKTANVIPALTSNVPAIIYNDVFDETQSSAARTDFFYTTCGVLNKEPAICSL